MKAASVGSLSRTQHSVFQFLSRELPSVKLCNRSCYVCSI